MKMGAVARALCAIAFLSAMDASIKALSARYPAFEIAFLRFAIGACLSLAPFLVLTGGRPARGTIVANGLRSLLVVVAATSFFYALGRLPLAEAIALSFLAPVFMAVLGVVALRESFDRPLVGALAAGLAGMVVMVSGQGEAAERSLDGVIAALAAAVAYAMSMVLLRARATRDSVATIVFLWNLGPALLLAVPAGLVWTSPRADDLPLFAAVGLFGIVGHALFVQAFARAAAAFLAPLEYTALLWGVILGYLVFNEVPGVATLVGAAFIVAGSFVAARRAGST